MSQNFHSPNNPRGRSPQNHAVTGTGNGYDLLTSLVSPGPATPIQASSAWPGMQGWESPMQSFFPQGGMPFPGQISFPQSDFIPNTQLHDYIPLGDDVDEESYDPESNPTLNNMHQPSVVDQPGRGTLEQQEDIPQMPKSAQPSLTETSAPMASTVPKIDSQKKAAELRAKLLANRPQSAASGRSNTPSKSKNISMQTNSKLRESMNEYNAGKLAQANSASLRSSDAKEKNGNKRNGVAGTETQGVTLRQPGVSADIEDLLAEGREAADEKQQILIPKIENSTTPGPMATSAPPFLKPDNAKEELDANESSSDEEGEIRGESTQPTSIDQPLKSVESRQDTTTEAQEKLDRQLETKSVYGALETGSGKQANRVPKKDAHVGPKATEETKSKPLSPKPNRNVYARATYDSYKPTRDARRELETDKSRDVRRRDSDEQRAFGTQVLEKETALQMKQRVEAKERELAELKRAQGVRDRQQALRNNVSRRDHTLPAQMNTHGAAEPSHRDKDVRMPDHSEPEPSPTSRRASQNEIVDAMLVDDRDLADWLELTEYHDEDLRLQRLSRFRKKKALEAQMAELEREERMELEERSNKTRAQTTISPPNTSFSPKILRRASIATIAGAKMPPPPLPLQPREGNIDAIAQPQTTPILKRHLAEADTDARLPEKYARSDTGNRTRGSSPTTSIKGEPLSARLPPLEDRISRDGPDRYPPRRRSPSPNTYAYRPASRERRRSYSPRSRDFNPHAPGPERQHQKACFNCNQPDHQNRDCPYPRRDGRDGKGAIPLKEAPGGFAVSQNYKGKNPRPFVEKRPPPYERGRGAGRGENGSRVSSLGKNDGM